MSRAAPRLFSVPFGAPFLPTLADALLSGRLVQGFPAPGDPLALAAATIYVPTRRAARALRGAFAERRDLGAAILPAIRPLGEFEEDAFWFDPQAGAALDPPIDPLERRLRLAPLVRRWKERLPLRLRDRYAEGVVVPATAADALWLADELARLIDEVESEDASWSGLAALAEGELAGWWEVTLEFLRIVTESWPRFLADNGRSDPAAWRGAALRAEAARLAAAAPAGPVVAAGSTGSIRATADLLNAIAALPNGAVVLPGFDAAMDAETRAALAAADDDPTAFGHPQFGLAALLRRLKATPDDVAPLAQAPASLARRGRLVAEALRPAAATAAWPRLRSAVDGAAAAEAFSGVALVEAAAERDEALAIAVALRRAIETPGATAALITPDRALARRVAAELLRFGVRADDSGGTPFAATPQGTLLGHALDAALRPGDPATILSLLKHPLVCAGMQRAEARRAAEMLELIALRGGVGRPDVADLPGLLEARLVEAQDATRPPAWRRRLDAGDVAAARRVAVAVSAALAPLTGLRGLRAVALSRAAEALAGALEALAVDAEGSLERLYAREPGEALAAFLRGLVCAEAPFDLDPDEAPEAFGALVASVTVKPRAVASRRIAIWGALEARLQSVDTLVVGGLNEGTWPRQPEPGQFLSRLMKAELALSPPERQIGQSAHDFFIALGAPQVVLTRAARSGDAPAVASRWLERLDAFLGAETMGAMRRRGDELLRLAQGLDATTRVDFARRPEPKPPLALRPRSFSVTEIETLRRDPYAVYARRVLALEPLEPLLSDPGAAERGTLLHAILARFVAEGVDPVAPGALARLLAIGEEEFAQAGLPPDVAVAWRPRFGKTAAAYVAWERSRPAPVAARFAETRAKKTPVDASGATLSGRADRIDLRPDGTAELLDFKTGSTPSKKQAHTLIAPQLALEAALLRRGAFAEVGERTAVEVAHVRLKANGEVRTESVLVAGTGADRSEKSAEELGEEAWSRLIELLDWFGVEANGYRSRVLPLRERDRDGDYDHLARVLEWSAGGDAGEEDGEEP